MNLKKETIVIVDAPAVCMAEDDKAGDVLLKFYHLLGWNGDDVLDPCKVRTTKDVYDRLYDAIFERCPDPVGVGMFMVNRGPGTEDYIKPNKVHLLEGWVTPVDNVNETGEEDA